MVIRLTKATKFFCLCALLLVSVLISIGTRSITVSTPYAPNSEALPVLIYRTAAAANELASDMAYLSRNGYTVISETELTAALRRQSPLPARPVLLVFDEGMVGFSEQIAPSLKAKSLPWFGLSKLGALSNELRTAGYPVTRLERIAGVAMEQYIL